MDVFSPENMRAISSVQELIFDPDSGKVIGIVIDSRRGKVVTPMDIISIKHSVLIRSVGDVVDVDDVLRIKEVVDSGRNVMGKKVVTESGKSLGKVVDATIDENGLSLAKIYTAKVVFGIIQHDQRIIPSKNIVEVLADKVVVKDDGGEVVERQEEAEAVGAGA